MARKIPRHMSDAEHCLLTGADFDTWKCAQVAYEIVIVGVELTGACGDFDAATELGTDALPMPLGAASQHAWSRRSLWKKNGCSF